MEVEEQQPAQDLYYTERPLDKETGEIETDPLVANVGLTVSALPQYGLKPGLSGLFPIDLDSKEFNQVLERRTAESGDESAMDSFIRDAGHMFVVPFLVRTSGLLTLLVGMDGRRYANFAAVERLESIRDYVTITELYMHYRKVVLSIETSPTVQSVEFLKDRLASINKRGRERCLRELQLFRRRLQRLPGMQTVETNVQLNPGQPLVSWYTPELAEQLTVEAFRHCVMVINILELSILELLQINPRKAREHGFLTRPELVTLSEGYRHIGVVQNEYIAFCGASNEGVTVQAHRYNMEHIRQHTTAKAPYYLSPSAIYQNMLFAVGIHRMCDRK
jgi:hypothetical protein